jgi:succinate dehydrogenase/fumarate reductase flavoprotein subunit
VPAWLVCDSHFLWTYGLGAIRPFRRDLRHETATGYLHSAGSIAALAKAINVPSDALVQTVSRFNAGAAQGRDDEFGRGGDAYQRYLGDATVTPNPCVAPILKPPFHAIAVFPAELGAATGLVTDEDARVLDGDGRPIPGLHAVGNDMHSVMGGAYPGPGITLGPALTFAWLAARRLASPQARAS